MKKLIFKLLWPHESCLKQKYWLICLISPIILYTWVERDNVEKSILSKETTRWQGLGVESPTFRSEVQRANHYSIAPLSFYIRYKIFDFF